MNDEPIPRMVLIFLAIYAVGRMFVNYQDWKREADSYDKAHINNGQPKEYMDP